MPDKSELYQIDASSKINELTYLSILTWNIEGFSRNYHSLRSIAEKFSPSLIFLSEPMIYQSDLPPLLLPFRGVYEAHLNSEDLFEPDLALDKVKAKRGTMVLWKASLSPFVTVLPSESSCYQSVLLKLPNSIPSVHTVLYLPTSGKEQQYMSSLVELEAHVTEIRSKFPCAAHFLRGDANANPNNKARYNLFSHMCSTYSFTKVHIPHPTYHHFVGDGLFDSEIDILLFHGPLGVEENLDQILCKLESPFVDSLHDVILSTCSFPTASSPPADDQNITAPRVINDRIKIIWDEQGITDYEEFISSHLSSLRECWGNPDSRTSVSVLLASTYSCLSLAARSTNPFIELGSDPTIKPTIDPKIKAKEKIVLKAKKQLDFVLSSTPTPSSIESAKLHLCTAKADLRQSVRAEKAKLRNQRAEKFSSILSSNPSAAHRQIKSARSSQSKNVHTLHVKNKTYVGSSVPDGFYDSLSSLKAPDLSDLHSSPHYQETLLDYENVLKLARDGQKMPPISPKTSTEILHSLRENVNDRYSITAAHFIHAGMEGLQHFHFLLNIIIDDVNLSSLEELNTIWACILHKGHGKDRESDRSYRTISTCPLLAKALDFYAGQIYGEGWAEAQADTQFQGANSSHELAGLLLTEAINFSLFSTKEPVFLLLLDAKSAFDLILRENIVVNAFKAGTQDHGLHYLMHRLANRLTYCEWDKQLMGPIQDLLGAEPGGINSDRLYKLVNNDQIKVAQLSQMGISMFNQVISCIGQADDTALLFNDIHKFQNLLLLTMEYCKQHNVTLVPEKTKLLAFCPAGSETEVDYAKIISPINIYGQSIPFSDSAEHVGIVRSVHGNLPNIQARLSAHKRAVFSVLPAGMARGHHSNPAAAMRVERLYGAPVMLSGVATMVLSKLEIGIVSGHYKQHTERLLKLLRGTPECVVWFLSGCLPAEALLHLRLFSLFGMICRLNNGDNLLADLARNVLASSKPSARSWFSQLQPLCLKYSLPHPIFFLDNKLPKLSFKHKVRAAVIDYWEQQLRGEASNLDSLQYFHPQFMSLSTTHPLFQTCGTSPYQVKKSEIQAQFLSGRARVEALTRNWDPTNKEGFCKLCKDTEPVLGTIEHLLLSGGCPALAGARLEMISFFQAYMVSRQYLLPIFRACWGKNDTNTMQLILDCSTIPLVIHESQLSEHPVLQDIFYLTRTYIFKIYTTRKRLLSCI